MDGLIKQYTPLLFPVFFVFLWLAVTTTLWFLSGWYSLMRKYPNREDEALLEIGFQSGLMGWWISMGGILNISTCHSGLRIGIMRIFGVFCRDFFVPWEEIRVARKDWFFWQSAELQFGNPPIGRLVISAHIGDRLARSALGHWPEAGPFPQERKIQAFVSVLKQWMLSTIIAALFFTMAPRLASSVGGFPPGAGPPVSVAIIFPAVVFGIAGIFRYFRRIGR
jgi:hypothetical protein